MAIDYVDIKKPNELNIESKARCYTQWLGSMGLIDDVTLNNLIIYIISFHKSIKDVEIFIDNKNKTISFLIYLSRWGLYWHSNKIYKQLKENLSEYLPNKNIKINFDIFRDKNE